MTVSVDKSNVFNHTEALLAAQSSNRHLKRKRFSLEDEACFLEDDSMTIESPIKKQRLTEIQTTFAATKDAICNILFIQRNSTSLINSFEFVGSTLKVGDFCSRAVLSAYQNESGEYTVPEFELVCSGNNSAIVLTYLRGIMARKDEAAVVPIPSATHQLLVFEKEPFKSVEVFDDDDGLCFPSTPCTSSILHAILVPKFNLVFDLDETLIRSRMPLTQDEVPKPSEHEFFVQGTRIFTAVRPGTETVLKWACKLFNVYVFTNGVYDYAKEICKILDPTRTTILANVNLEDDSSWRKFLKPRDQMITCTALPKAVGIKDLSKFGLDERTSVCFDDDSNVWVQKENLLPFFAVTQSQQPQDFFYKMRIETWSKLAQLSKKLGKKKITFSQENIL